MGPTSSPSATATSRYAAIGTKRARPWTYEQTTDRIKNSGFDNRPANSIAMLVTRPPTRGARRYSTDRLAGLSSRREEATGSLAGGAWRLAVGLGGASGPQGGLGVVLNLDGEPGVRLGRDVRGAWPVGVGRDSVRLSARFGGEHLHVRADAPLPAVPKHPAVDEPGLAVRPAVEPGRFPEFVGGVPVGIYVAAGSVVVRGGPAGSSVVCRLRGTRCGVRRGRSRVSRWGASHPRCGTRRVFLG